MILGVDPGLSGAWALLSTDGRTLAAVGDMPAADGAVSGHLLAASLLSELCAVGGIDVAWLEMPGPMPRQGVSSTWRFARSVGVVEGVLAGLGIPTRTVSPSKWKKSMGLSADKGASRALAASLWPDSADLFRRVRDDGRAEAALIAEYGRRHR